MQMRVLLELKKDKKMWGLLKLNSFWVKDLNRDSSSIKRFKENMKVNVIRFSLGFDLGIDILHIYCPKSYESKESIKGLLDSYYKIILEAIRNNYSKIVSVSLGTGINGYKHKDIAKQVVDRLDWYAKIYAIDFTLVLPNEEIRKIYSNYIGEN